MYEALFNLTKKPFELVPNPEFIYLSRTHKKALHYLNYGISEKAGFVLLTGEVGSGKTTLITDLIRHLGRDVTLSKVFNTKVNSDQLLAMINDDFGLDVKGKDKITLLRDLNDFLIDQHAKRSHVVLIIDEAQNLTSYLLEETMEGLQGRPFRMCVCMSSRAFSAIRPTPAAVSVGSFP